MESLQKDFLAQFAVKQKELGRAQREYRRLLDKKLLSRKEKMFLAGLEVNIRRLRIEKDELQAKIYASDGTSNQMVNDRYLEQIKCHVECQEGLAEKIHDMKLGIKHMERETARTHRVVLRLNRMTVPENQFLAYVERWRKKLNLLEGQLEVTVRRECVLAEENGQLREQLLLHLNRRHFFNDAFVKQVARLNSDRKYMIELIEYASSMYDNCINAYERMDNSRRKANMERDERKLEMQAVMRKLAAEEADKMFMSGKGKHRELADLHPKEYRRREQYRRVHLNKIKLFTGVLEKLKKYTESENIQAVIEKFREQESLYYSYFTYANEMGYHMEMLDRSIKNLFTTVQRLKQEENDTLDGQLATIANLEETLERKQKKNEKLRQRSDEQDKGIDKLLADFHQIFIDVKADWTPMLMNLGYNETIDIGNAQQALKILEKRLTDIVACVYVMERQHERKHVDTYRVADILKEIEEPTKLDEIVLTQQCPECGEGEAFAMDEGDEGVRVQTVQEVKKKLYEKVQQPEMQYRLHSISQCRLPRSRLLAAKRNM